MKPRRITALTSIASIALIGFIAGCYSYVPVDAGSLPPRSDVRAYLTADQAARLDPLVLRDQRVVEGQLLENGAADLLLLVPVSGPVSGNLRSARDEMLHQRIRVSSADVVQLELRQLDRTRTGLLIAGGAALVGGVLIAQLTGKGGGDTSVPEPTPPENRIPLGVRVRF